MLAKHVLCQLSYAPGGVRRPGAGPGRRPSRSGRDAADRRAPGPIGPAARAAGFTSGRLAPPLLLRKEVIQPQVPLRLPCYDFIPITTHTLDTCAPCGFGRRLWVQTAFMM